MVVLVVVCACHSHTNAICTPKTTCAACYTALALMLLGLGLVFRDGAAVLLSAAIATMAVLYTGGLGMAAWLWGMAPLLHWLQA